MKEPKYLLIVAGMEFVVPDSNGIATLLRVMEHAVPVRSRLSEKVIELSYTEQSDEDYCRMVEYLREVQIKKIPAGTEWRRKTKTGEVQVVKIVTRKIKAAAPKVLPGPKRAALPPRSNQLALL